MSNANDLAGMLLERCEALGVGACVLTRAGGFTASTPRPRTLPILLRTARALAVLGGAGEQHIVDICPGLSLVVVPYVNARGEHGRLAALTPSPAFAQHPEFAEVCRQASADPGVVRADLSQFARYDDNSRAVLRGVLEATIQDALAVHERDDALGSFTRQLAESYDTIDLLYSLGRSMHGPFDGPGFVGVMCDRLLTTMSFGWIGAFFDESPGTAARLRGLSVVRGAPPCEASALRRAAIQLLSQGTFPLVTSEAPGLASDSQPQVAAMSLSCKNRPCGLLVVGGKHGEDPFVSSYDTQLLEASGGLMSAFCDNVALYEDQHALFMGTVGALTAAIDAKDRYTFGHSERVAWMSRALALRSGFTEAQAERIHIAGLVHDVGKIGVPEGVLCKPGKLTDEEFALIKQHPEIGHRILRDIPGLADILPGVLHHHERLDGRGYPGGLKGMDIPLIARLIGVADTFDAMSSNRSYRAGMPRERVLAEIQRSAGTQLDPDIAATLLTLDLSGYDTLFEKHVPRLAQAA